MQKEVINNDKVLSEQKIEHELFDIGILLKGIHALIEIIGGAFTFLISPHFVLRIVTKITQGELFEDPNDFLTRYFVDFAHSISVGTKQFIAFYLLSHGITNLILVIGLFKKKIWAYHASFVVLTLFALYQIYRYIYHPSIWMIILTIFDFIVLWLIWREYERIKGKWKPII
ncbi:MAG: DUF2127 domain-containing protein [Patescibacteria group bacterium]|nr:DUF2127 domain-containing protein [Patescibacteria group bacterium]